MTKADLLAVIRIRGEEGIHYDIKKTLKMLHLHKKHCCTILNNTLGTLGMLKKAKDYVTWGTISDETLKLLQEKRGSKSEKLFRLHPPRGGFERKGIKQPFAVGGALGDRKELINQLIRKML